jgi:hypothetical protein
LRAKCATDLSRFARENDCASQDEAVSGLGSVIAAQLGRWGGVDLPLERALFGTTDPDAIAAAMDNWCREHLGAGIERYEFFDSSSGSVHGVVLNDGRPVVVKGHRAAVDPAYLRAVAALRVDLVAAGYPAPRPLAGPVRGGAGHLTAEELRPRSAPDDPSDPDVVQALAVALARLVALASPHHEALASVGHPMDVRADHVYPAPHSERFDFAATAVGAEWIDELAAAARVRLATVAPTSVVAHGDWRVQNVSVRDGQVDAVYDWESVAVLDELTMIAIAATTFTVDWERTEPRFPTPAETMTFVAAYGDARGAAFTDSERDRLAVAMVATMSYGARCEHADPTGTRTDQRDRLATLAPQLLDAGLDALT